MTSITFTQGANVVSIDCNLVFGTDWYDIRLNQYEVITADGGNVVYDNGPTMCHGVMIMKGVSYTHGNNLRTWLKSYAIWAYNTFTISAISNVDLGKGKNTAITLARYDGGSNLSGVFEFVAPGIYNVRLPYRFTRT